MLRRSLPIMGLVALAGCGHAEAQTAAAPGCAIAGSTFHDEVLVRPPEGAPFTITVRNASVVLEPRERDVVVHGVEPIVFDGLVREPLVFAAHAVTTPNLAVMARAHFELRRGVGTDQVRLRTWYTGIEIVMSCADLSVGPSPEGWITWGELADSGGRTRWRVPPGLPVYPTAAGNEPAFAWLYGDGFRDVAGRPLDSTPPARGARAHFAFDAGGVHLDGYVDARRMSQNRPRNSRAGGIPLDGYGGGSDPWYRVPVGTPIYASPRARTAWATTSVEVIVQLPHPAIHGRVGVHRIYIDEPYRRPSRWIVEPRIEVDFAQRIPGRRNDEPRDLPTVAYFDLAPWPTL